MNNPITISIKEIRYQEEKYHSYEISFINKRKRLSSADDL